MSGGMAYEFSIRDKLERGVYFWIAAKSVKSAQKRRAFSINTWALENYIFQIFLFYLVFFSCL